MNLLSDAELGEDGKVWSGGNYIGPCKPKVPFLKDGHTPICLDHYLQITGVHLPNMIDRVCR